MSKTLKIILSILLVAMVIFAYTVFNILNLNKTGIEKINSQSSIVKSQIIKSSSTSNKSQISSESKESKAESIVEIQSSKTAEQNSLSAQINEKIDGIEVTYLDSNNPPQYIMDYEDCQTKNISGHYGVFLEEDSLIKYYCPPKISELGCKNTINYIYKPENISEKKIFEHKGKDESGKEVVYESYLMPYQLGWNCDLFYSGEVAYPFMVNVCDLYSQDLLFYINKNDTNVGGCISLKKLNVKSPLIKPEHFYFNKLIILK
jgi:hypothetical protein